MYVNGEFILRNGYLPHYVALDTILQVFLGDPYGL